MTSRPPKWIKSQLTRLVEEAPTGGDWLHEIKYDGCRMHARIDGGKVQLLTRMGLDWSHRYARTIEALGALRLKTAYLDGELCALNAAGVPAFMGELLLLAGRMHSERSPFQRFVRMLGATQSTALVRCRH